MQIDTATEADVPALADLLSILFAQESEFTPNPEAQRRGLLAIVTNPAVGVLRSDECRGHSHAPR